MLKWLFPRFGSQFPEGGIIHAKFVKAGAGSPTYAFKSNAKGASYPGLSLAHNAGAGLARLTLAGGAKQIAPLDISVKGQSAAIGTAFKAYHYGINEAAGTLDIKFADSSATEAIANIADGDEVWVTLYVAK